jgi:hypothetical protein
MNRLQHGLRSPEYRRFLKALMDAPPCEMGLAAQAFFAKNPVHHPLFLDIAEMFVRNESDMCKQHTRWCTEEE